MKKKILIIAIVMCIATSLFLVACNDNSSNGRKYQVSFVVNGGSEVATEYIEKSKSIDVEPVTTKSGFIFKGWYADSRFSGNRITFPYVVETHTTLHAKWEEISLVRVIFSPNNGEDNQTLFLPVGDSVNEPIAPTKTDCTFLGWYDWIDDSANKIVFPYRIQEHMVVVTFHAKWQLAVATLNFVTNCDASVDDIRVNVGETIKLKKMTREGYNFLGWYNNQYFSGSAIADNYAPTDNATLYAKWEKITYTITFNTDGYPLRSKTINFGNTFTADIPCKDESVFEGWYDNKDFAGDPLSFPYVPSASMTMYAKWSPSTANSYFSFEKTSNNIDYIVKKAEGIDLPAEVVIPDSYLGAHVVDIAQDGFANSNTLLKVWIGVSVKNVQYGAFKNCVSLTNAYMKDSIIFIGESAFEGCSSLTDFVVPKNIIYLNTGVFKDCTSLTKVVLQEGVVTIGNSAFANCLRLSDINFPNSINYFAQKAFYGCTSLENVILPINLKNLSESQFSGCTELSSIYFYKNIEFIYSGIFFDCPKLKNITIEAGCEKYRSENNSIIDIANETLIIACNGTDKIADGIKKIERGAFENVDIVSVTLPSSINEIESRAFSNCSSLESVVIEFDTNTINDFRLSNIFSNVPALKSVELKAGTVIPGLVFLDFTQITNIVIPTTTKTIGARAFIGCESLQSIVLPEGLETIGGFAFNSCKSLISITIPSTTKTIGPSAFGGCERMQSIVLPEGLEIIEKSVFNDCKSLTTMTIPTTTKTIGYYAFGYCESLQSIVLPEGLETIEMWAFRGCKGLTNVTLPSTFKTPDNTSMSIFQNCVNMKILTILATTPPNPNCFYDANWRLEKIRVPSASLASYQGYSAYSSYTLEGI